jgi:hypothetical protein
MGTPAQIALAKELLALACTAAEENVPVTFPSVEVSEMPCCCSAVLLLYSASICTCVRVLGGGGGRVNKVRKVVLFRVSLSSLTHSLTRSDHDAHQDTMHRLVQLSRRNFVRSKIEIPASVSVGALIGRVGAGLATLRRYGWTAATAILCTDCSALHKISIHFILP